MNINMYKYVLDYCFVFRNSISEIFSVFLEKFRENEYLRLSQDQDRQQRVNANGRLQYVSSVKPTIYKKHNNNNKNDKINILLALNCSKS